MDFQKNRYSRFVRNVSRVEVGADAVPPVYYDGTDISFSGVKFVGSNPTRWLVVVTNVNKYMRMYARPGVDRRAEKSPRR